MDFFAENPIRPSGMGSDSKSELAAGMAGMRRLLGLSCIVLAVGGLFAAPIASRAGQQPAPATVQGPTAHHPLQPGRVPARAKDYYLAAWGVDNLLVRQTASTNLIRFSYRVVSPPRAEILGDKRATPYLIGLRSHAVLQVPVMEKIGQLRQTGVPIAGKEYWMVFSNKGNLVKVGDRVNVVIGTFHADGLIVE